MRSFSTPGRAIRVGAGVAAAALAAACVISTPSAMPSPANGAAAIGARSGVGDLPGFGSPTAVENPSGALEVFAMSTGGATSQLQVWSQTGADGAWEGPANLGGNFSATTAPAVVATATGVTVLENGSTGIVEWRQSLSGAWTGPVTVRPPQISTWSGAGAPITAVAGPDGGVTIAAAGNANGSSTESTWQFTQLPSGIVETEQLQGLDSATALSLTNAADATTVLAAEVNQGVNTYALDVTTESGGVWASPTTLQAGATLVEQDPDFVNATATNSGVSIIADDALTNNADAGEWSTTDTTGASGWSGPIPLAMSLESSNPPGVTYVANNGDNDGDLVVVGPGDEGTDMIQQTGENYPWSGPFPVGEFQNGVAMLKQSSPFSFDVFGVSYPNNQAQMQLISGFPGHWTQAINI